mmetsp:Transcript_148164/g.369401  ORF Transcript_148164/g.369401 Transcript_148164/m.369401 type:complete len:268 (-) Transcript_148164:21-824(-)
MPHLLVERLRECPKVLDCACLRNSGFPFHAIAVETSDLVAGIIFVVGSYCFLPEYSKDLKVFLAGCVLYVVGGVIYMLISLCTLIEALIHHKSFTLEVFEHFLYAIGSWLFLAGTVLYWPKKAHYDYIETMKGFALGQYFNFFSPEFEGTVLFALGSVLFAFAAFTNALNHRKFEAEMSQMLTAVTTIDMAGDMLFIIGSVAFLPDLGCNDKMLAIGAWSFIVGSVFFVVGALISIYRTLRIWRTQEREALLPANKALGAGEHEGLT